MTGNRLSNRGKWKTGVFYFAVFWLALLYQALTGCEAAFFAPGADAPPSVEAPSGEEGDR